MKVVVLLCRPEAALMECWMFKLCKSADCTLEQLAGLVDIDRV